MSRAASPGLAPEVAYPEPSTGHALSAQSTYYDPTEPRQLMTDEMMEDISRITEASRPGLTNGQHHDLPLMQPESQQARPITPPSDQHSMGVAMSMQSQQYTTDMQAGDTYTDGSSKRKRSKVSRACDECRRKKIRCDATKDDGTVETCSNCKRIHTTCTFSRVPMKRGPSKGYIKELSERVQQVEHQMETQRSFSHMAPPLGFRHSLDGRQSMDSNSSGTFDGLFSPAAEGPSTKKRTYSTMSEGGGAAGPFSHFLHRDRMPSTAGGWGITPASQGFRDARLSIAIAPDQLPDLPPGPLPAPSTLPDTPRSVNPFWVEPLGLESRKDKPPIAEVLADEEVLPASAVAGYKNYLRQVHGVLPLLSSTTIPLERHMRACLSSGSRRLVTALQRSLSLLDTSSGDPQAQDAGDIVDLLYAQARKSSRDRNQSENFVLLWLCSLVYISQDNEISRQKQTDLRYLLQLMIDISLSLIRDTNTESTEATESDIDSDKNLARRSFNVVAFLARLYSLGSGVEDLIPDDDEVWNFIADSDDLAMLSDTTAVLARYCNFLAALRLDTLLAPSSTADGRVKAHMNGRILRQQLRDIKTKLPDPMSTSATEMVQQLDLLFNLVSARNLSKINLYASVEVFAFAEAISNYLLRRSASASDIVDPVLAHLYALATITLLEFTAVSDPTSPREEDPATIALSPLSNILLTLKRLEPLLRRPSLGANDFKWTNALMRLILSRHPDILGSRSSSINAQNAQQSEGQAAYSDDTTESGLGHSQTQRGINGSNANGASADETSTNDRLGGSVDPALSSNIGHGHPLHPLELGSPTSNGISADLQSIRTPVHDRPPVSTPLTQTDGDGAKAVGKATMSATWQSPDFTLLQKHGWMSVLAELTA